MAKNKTNLVKMLSVESSFWANFLEVWKDQKRTAKDKTPTNKLA